LYQIIARRVVGHLGQLVRPVVWDAQCASSCLVLWRTSEDPLQWTGINILLTIHREERPASQ